MEEPSFRKINEHRRIITGSFLLQITALLSSYKSGDIGGRTCCRDAIKDIKSKNIKF